MHHACSSDLWCRQINASRIVVFVLFPRRAEQTSAHLVKGLYRLVELFKLLHPQPLALAYELCETNINK
jgi:hypothetical protein